MTKNQTKTKTSLLIGTIVFFLIIAGLFAALFFVKKSQRALITSEKQTITSQKIYGIIGGAKSAFADIASLGSNTTQLKGPVSSDELLASLKIAKSLNLKMGGRAEGQNKFQTSTNKIDLPKLQKLLSNTFASKVIANSPNFAYYYIIDEPCHPDKWDISQKEFETFYKTVKNVNPNIKILVNFGDLSCLRSYLPDNCADWHITDIAAFTVTKPKMQKSQRQENNYISTQGKLASEIKSCSPNLEILPLLAIYEYPDKNVPIPSASWVKDTGLEVLKYNDFDGLMYYPWSPSSYMGNTIEDIASDPEYINAFQAVFTAAKKK